jgi:hypothetical protein
MSTAKEDIMARLSENLIAISIVPQHVARWLERGTTPAMTSAYDCVVAFKDLVRAADLESLQVEQNRELSAEAIRKRRSMICDKAMTKLANFKAFHVAEKALIDEINRLERLSDPDPQQAQMRDKLNQALRDLREGVEATRRLVQERCKIRERASVW